MLIESLQNTRIKKVVRLRRRPARDKEGLFIIEGYRELLRASEMGWPIEELFYCPELFLGENEMTLIEKIADADVAETTRPVFEKMAYRDRPDGLIAIAKQKPLSLADFPKIGSGVVMVAESIEKPGNLGTILRSCDAFGANGVIVCDPVTDPYNPNVVRASLGTLFCQPVALASSEEALKYLQDEGFQIIATTPDGDEILSKVHFESKAALVVGAEQFGLSSTWIEGADRRVKIPMQGQSDSLNVAMAATVFLYEALRAKV